MSHLVLDEDKRLLQSTAREFMSERSPVSALRALRDARDARGWSPELWTEMAQLGWIGAALPETYGGSEMGFSSLLLLIEESGRTLCSAPLISCAGVCAPLIVAEGSEAQRAELLPPLISGAASMALALEEGPRHAPTQVETRAIEKSGQWTLDGGKHFVADGFGADKWIVVARVGQEPADAREGLGLFLVDGDAAGVDSRRLWMVDSRNAARLRFRDTPATPLGDSLGASFESLDVALDRARMAMAAEMLGAAQEVFERTVEYLKQREQFDTKIGAFQGLQHRAAHLFSELELSRSALLDAAHAADSLDAPEADADARRVFALAASAVKLRANETFELATKEAVQMHGGIGMTDELEVGFFAKRWHIAAQLYGASDFHRDRFAELSGF